MSPLRRVALALCVGLLAACGPLVQGGRSDLVSAHVTAVRATTDRPSSGAATQPVQGVSVQLDDSLYRGEVVDVTWAGRRALDRNGLLQPGDRVLLTLTRNGSDRSYAIAEVVRLPALLPIGALVLLALAVVARTRGLAALVAPAASIAVVLVALVPAVQRGDDPLLASLVGGVGAIVVSTLVLQGTGRASLATLCGAMAGLGVVTAAGAFAIAAARVTGLGSEDQILLLAGAGGRLDMPRLALAAAAIGSLGAIVDLSAGQSAEVLRLASDETLRGRRLFVSALDAGSRRIGPLMNTLALAYLAGALPVVLLLTLGSEPLSISANGEQLTGSLIAIAAAAAGLVLSVPVTTLVAVLFAGSARARD